MTSGFGSEPVVPHKPLEPSRPARREAAYVRGRIRRKRKAGRQCNGRGNGICRVAHRFKRMGISGQPYPYVDVMKFAHRNW